MLLAIDVGNTNSAFALFEGDSLRAQWRASTSTQRTADEYATWLHQLLEMAGTGFAEVSACVISTVVPQSLFHLRNLARRYLGFEPYIVRAADVPGIAVRLPKPSEAGADRLVNAIAAYTHYHEGQPILVVDSGTATNFDIVGDDGAFEGGVIAPGINLSVQALHNAAALLPRIAIEQPDKIIGTDTVGAMQTGIFWGYVELIDGLCRKIRSEYGQPMTMIATGGVSSLFEGALTEVQHFDADLTMKGLLEVHKRLLEHGDG